MKKVFAVVIIGLMICSVAYATQWTESDLRKATSGNANLAVALSATSVEFNRAVICAETDNSAPVAIGGSTVIASIGAQRGQILLPIASGGVCAELDCGEAVCGDLADIYLHTQVPADGVSVRYSRSR